MRKYILTIGQPSQRRQFQQVDYGRNPLPSLYKDLPFDSPPFQDFEIAFNTFCISGEFSSGRKNVERLIENEGGILYESVGSLTNYVIVGDNPSKGWKFGNYGTKIDRAIEIRKRNPRPLIIREADFLSLLSTVGSPEQLLDRLLEGRLRSTVMLDPFLDGYTNGWACCLPTAFRAALDIQQTVRTEARIERLVWTQGKNFFFGVGDIIYDTRQAYELPWGEALGHINFALQVQKSQPTEIGFNVLVPNEAKTTLVPKQSGRALPSEFVRLLITGTCAGIEA